MFGLLPTPPSSSCTRGPSSHSWPTLCPVPAALPIAARPRHSTVFSSSSFWVLAQRKLRHYCDSVILLFCAAFLALALTKSPSPLSPRRLPQQLFQHACAEPSPVALLILAFQWVSVCWRFDQVIKCTHACFVQWRCTHTLPQPHTHTHSHSAHPTPSWTHSVRHSIALSCVVRCETNLRLN